jgi:hypothetical protein
MKIVKIFALLPALVVVACSNGTMGSVSFSLTARRAASPAPSAAFSSGAPAAAATVAAAGDSTVIALAPDTIIVRSAQLVLRKVELKRADVASCDAIMGNGDCEDFETGSKLLTLPLGSAVIAQDVSISAPAGMFDELEFEVHKPSSTDDAAFIAANPDFATISIRVTGTFVHGTGSGAGTRSDFTFTSDVDQSQKASLVPPMTLKEGQTLNVTLRVDISTWYLNATKTALVDPASANKGGPNDSVVANNIQNSFKAFEDDNRDGLEG